MTLPSDLSHTRTHSRTHTRTHAHTHTPLRARARSLSQVLQTTGGRAVTLPNLLRALEWDLPSSIISKLASMMPLAHGQVRGTVGGASHAREGGKRLQLSIHVPEEEEAEEEAEDPQYVKERIGLLVRRCVCVCG